MPLAQGQSDEPCDSGACVLFSFSSSTFGNTAIVFALQADDALLDLPGILWGSHSFFPVPLSVHFV
jgi:hypothetical protein